MAIAIEVVEHISGHVEYTSDALVIGDVHSCNRPAILLLRLQPLQQSVEVSTAVGDAQLIFDLLHQVVVKIAIESHIVLRLEEAAFILSASHATGDHIPHLRFHPRVDITQGVDGGRELKGWDQLVIVLQHTAVCTSGEPVSTISAMDEFHHP